MSGKKYAVIAEIKVSGARLSLISLKCFMNYGLWFGFELENQALLKGYRYKNQTCV